jgi:hypothetical protein
MLTHTDKLLYLLEEYHFKCQKLNSLGYHNHTRFFEDLASGFLNLKCDSQVWNANKIKNNFPFVDLIIIEDNKYIAIQLKSSEINLSKFIELQSNFITHKSSIISKINSVKIIEKEIEDIIFQVYNFKKETRKKNDNGNGNGNNFKSLYEEILIFIAKSPNKIELLKLESLLQEAIKSLLIFFPNIPYIKQENARCIKYIIENIIVKNYVIESYNYKSCINYSFIDKASCLILYNSDPILENHWDEKLLEPIILEIKTLLNDHKNYTIYICNPIRYLYEDGKIIQDISKIKSLKNTRKKEVEYFRLSFQEERFLNKLYVFDCLEFDAKQYENTLI